MNTLNSNPHSQHCVAGQGHAIPAGTQTLSTTPHRVAGQGHAIPAGTQTLSTTPHRVAGQGHAIPVGTQTLSTTPHRVAGQGHAIPAHSQQRSRRLPAARSAATLLLLLVALLLPLAASAAKPQPRAAVQIAQKTYDFGTVKQTDPSVVHVFKIQNTGDAPLVIISATASCGCTRPTFTDHPVAPGQEAEIKVTFVPRGQLGDINKEVKVRTNAPDAKRFSLRITGKVTP